MDELLSAVQDAHGGLANWTKATRITARLSLGGVFWAARGWPDVYKNQTVILDPHREHISFAPFTASGRVSVLDVDPERVTITAGDGSVIEERTNPRATFPPAFVPASTPWDAIQVAYFTSAAVWNYLTAPFVFSRPGVVVREIAPWDEGGETWRRLAVDLPEHDREPQRRPGVLLRRRLHAAAHGLLTGCHWQAAGRALHARLQDVRRLLVPDSPPRPPARRERHRRPGVCADHHGCDRCAGGSRALSLAAWMWGLMGA